MEYDHDKKELTEVLVAIGYAWWPSAILFFPHALS